MKKLCSTLPDDSNFIWILLIIQQWFLLEYAIFIFFTGITLIEDKESDTFYRCSIEFALAEGRSVSEHCLNLVDAGCVKVHQKAKKCARKSLYTFL